MQRKRLTALLSFAMMFATALNSAPGQADILRPIPVPGQPGSPGQPGFPDQPDFPRPPGSPDFPGQPHSDRLQVRLNRSTVGSQGLDVRNLVGLDRRYSGREVERVILRARSEAARGQANLLLDGVPTDRAQVVDSLTRDVVFYMNRGNRVDVDFRNLELRLNGRFFIESVTVELGSRRSPPPRPPVDRDWVEAYVGQQYFGRSILPVLQILQLDSRYRGRKIESVILTGRTSSGRGQATLMVNGYAEGWTQTIDTRNRDHTFATGFRSEIGTDLHRLEIELQGHFHVEKVAVKLESERGRGPNGHDIVVRERIEEDYRGNVVLAVDPLIGLNSSHMGLDVQQVIVRTRARGTRGQVQLMINGRPEGMTQMVGTYPEDVVLTPSHSRRVYGQDIRSLGLSLQGDFTVEEITVIFSANSRW